MIKDPSKGILLLVSAAAIGNFLIAFDINMLNIALPTITSHYKLEVATSTWLVIIHGIVLCSLLLPFGKAGDVIGHRRLFLVGITVFTMGNLAAGISILLDDFVVLVVMRVFTAIGAAMMLSVNFAIISLNLPSGIRGRGLGYSSIFGSLGFMSGPVVSGFLLSVFPWNSIFILLAVISALGLGLGFKVIPDSGGSGHPADIIQTLAFFSMVLFSVLSINRVLIDGVTGLVIWSLLMAVLSATVVIWRQKVGENPLLDPELVFERRVMLPLLSMSFLFICFSGSMVILPFYMEYIKELDTASMGLLFVIPAVIISFLGPISGRMSDRRGSYGITLIAASTMVVSMLVFLSLRTVASLALLLLGLVLMGLAYGGFNAPNNRRVFCSVDEKRMGAASGMHQTSRHIGNVLGAATLPAVYHLFAGQVPTTKMMLDGFQASFLLGLVFAVIALLVSASISKGYRM